MRLYEPVEGQRLCRRYRSARRVEPCAQCGAVRVPRPGGPWCSTCYKTDPDTTCQCQACDEAGDLYEKGRCGRCVLAQRLQLLLGGGTGTVRAVLVASGCLPTRDE